jgi:hypothetical protein
MPWTANDAEKHTHKATTTELKELWANVANERLEKPVMKAALSERRIRLLGVGSGNRTEAGSMPATADPAPCSRRSHFGPRRIECPAVTQRWPRIRFSWWWL